MISFKSDKIFFVNSVVLVVMHLGNLFDMCVTYFSPSNYVESKQIEIHPILQFIIGMSIIRGTHDRTQYFVMMLIAPGVHDGIHIFSVMGISLPIFPLFTIFFLYVRTI